MKRLISCSAAFSLALSLGGCSALPPYQNGDPSGNLNVPIRNIVKSIRCEIVSYIVLSRIMNDLEAKARLRKDEISVAKYISLSLDSKEYASVLVDLKGVDTLGLTVGIDLKHVGKVASEDTHLGPGISGSRTHEFIQGYALAQNADLGSPLKQPGIPIPKAGKYTSAYAPQPAADQSFFCFNSLQKQINSIREEDAQQDILGFVVGSTPPGFAQFQRIHVGNKTLAHWLLDAGIDMVSNEKTISSPTSENLLAGLLNYSFALEIKPSLDTKYTLTAVLLNPLVPDLSYSGDYTSTFSIYLNTPESKAFNNAKVGGANIAEGPGDWVLRKNIAASRYQ